MAERIKAPISLRFNSVRLNDLSDDYGFGDDLDMSVVGDDVVVEEALEANNLQVRLLFPVVTITLPIYLTAPSTSSYGILLEGSSDTE
uniref:Uncharacterized protein n=1 Tax=Angiostrongylus cantonensis TaxID=6313 RepID=A0A0K0CWU5_ANGCA